MKNSWFLVKKFGITSTKNYIRQSTLQDPYPIYNSCYACEYDAQIAKSKNEQHNCKYCPINIDRCDLVYSILFQLSLAIQSNNRKSYEELCSALANASTKTDIQWE